MRKILILLTSSLFFYCLFRDMTLVKTLILGAAVASAYGISKIPAKYVLAAKYPMIVASLALCPALVLYGWLRSSRFVVPAVMLFGFYGIALFLITMEEKSKKIHKEIIGLSLLYAASVVNLFLTGHTGLIFPLSIAVLLFLFIINKVAIMPFIAVYTGIATAFLLIKGISILGPGVPLMTVERYALLGTGCALMIITFISYLKRTDPMSVLAFFGLLYVSVDLLLSVGFKVKGVLLYQPVQALFIVGPLVGAALKGGKERP